jgi:GNAT superfamily N-acetyltransferase
MWRTKYLQFREHAAENGVRSACRTALYKRERIVPVEKDLSELKPLPERPAGDGLRVVDLGHESFGESGLRHPLASRRERAPEFLRRGYRNLVLARNGDVVGDVWYVTRATARTREAHPHVQKFGLDLGDDGVYLFDMHVSSGARGGGLATYFMAAALSHLRERGMRRAYGYFVADNLPALWVHRLLGWRERPRLALQRFFVFEIIRSET